MRTIVLVIVILLIHANAAQYPDCVTCPDGSIPLSPLSYNTVRSNVFNGTQPSNEGCTDGAIVSRRVTINCGQKTTLIDCDQGYSDSADYSDLSDYFIWSRTESISQQMSITFRFYQQINISRLSLLFWNSPSNSITVPNVRIYWGNYFDGSNVLTQQVTNITTNLLNRTINGRHKLNIDNNNPGLQFQYLRIEMSFYYSNSEWIFLGEVQFCGNTAPYHITHPSTDNDVQIVSPTATMASVTCSLNVTIPDYMIITWEHNGQVSIIGYHENVIQTSHGTTLLIQNPQSSDAGVYQCIFNNAFKDGWVLRRNINLLITNPEIIHPSNGSYVISLNDFSSSVQLMCSLNVPISSSMTITWLHNDTVTMTPPNEMTTTGRTTTLVIRNPQPSDAGVYQCVFNDTVNGWILRGNITVISQLTIINKLTAVIATITGVTTATSVLTGSATITGVMTATNVLTGGATITGVMTATSVLTGGATITGVTTATSVLTGGATITTATSVLTGGATITGVTTATSVLTGSATITTATSVLTGGATITGVTTAASVLIGGATITGVTTATSVLTGGATTVAMASGTTALISTAITTSTVVGIVYAISSPSTLIATTQSQSITTTSTDNSSSTSSSNNDNNNNNNNNNSSNAGLIIASFSNNNNNNNNSNSSNAGLIIALVVLITIVFIIVIIIVIVVVVFWKERKRRQSTKPEEIYYSTIDEIKLQKITKNKPDAVNIEMNKDEHHQYTEISKHIYSIPQKVPLQKNPSYILSDQPVKIKDNLAYAISCEDQATIKDIESHAVSCEDQTTVQTYAIPCADRATIQGVEAYAVSCEDQTTVQPREDQATIQGIEACAVLFEDQTSVQTYAIPCEDRATIQGVEAYAVSCKDQTTVQTCAIPCEDRAAIQGVEAYAVSCKDQTTVQTCAIPCEDRAAIQGVEAYAVSCKDQTTVQAYAISCEDKITTQGVEAYAISCKD